MTTVRARVLSTLSGIIGVLGVWGAAAIGCSSSSGSAPQGEAGSPDSTMEATTEETGDAAPEATPITTPDATPDAAMGPDAVGDAQADVLVEGSAETGTGPSDGAAPDSEAGPPDAGPDAAALAAAFPGQVAAALCDRIAACCGTSGDAAAFNWSLCYGSELTAGFHGSNTGSNLLPGGNVVFNASAAQTCLSTLASVDCMANQVTSAQEKTLFQSCLGAYSGTLAAGAPCQGTIECAPGSFCLPVDGGVGDSGAIGQCESLVGTGGACGLFPGSDTTAAQTACSYRGAGANGLFCQSFDAGAPLQKLDAGTWTCAPQEALGTGCFSNVDCTSFICDPGAAGNVYKCANATEWFIPADCSEVIIDAGAGG